jgi:hypothetical protein
VSTFDTLKRPLSQVLQDVRSGAIQLPDFQRGWVWDDDRIRGLLASISLEFPIGAVMTLATGNADVRFAPRTIEGVALAQPREPDLLLLDGQQRLTSLYQALMGGRPVRTKDARGNVIDRLYYLDIAKALDPAADREDAIVGLPADRVVRQLHTVLLDCSTPEKEVAAGYLPLPLVFDVGGLLNWQQRYLTADPANMVARLQLWTRLNEQVLQPFQQYQVPIIALAKETPKEAVCQVFEKVNTGGVALTVFELLTATFAADGFDLRRDWDKRSKKLKDIPALAKTENTDFLQVVSLLATRERRREAQAQGCPEEELPGIGCKRKDILRLTNDEYVRWADAATDGFVRAGKFLRRQKLFSARDLPYRTQVVPLAAICAAMGQAAEPEGVQQRIARWYWCGVFGELYGSAVESRFARDLPEVLAWIAGGPEPVTVAAATFTPARLESMRTRNSAAYKGIAVFLMREGCRDFRTGDPIDVQIYVDEAIDIHHIFPQNYCLEQRIPAARHDNVINKTPLSARTNRAIGGSAPSVYLPKVEKLGHVDAATCDGLLRTHLIDPATLRANDFESFYAARSEALLGLVERAMGKSVVREGPVVVPPDGVYPSTLETVGAGA